MMKKYLIAIITLVSITLTCLGHEYVLLAYKYFLKMGDQLEVHLFVADGFNIQFERPLQKPLTRKFELITKTGVTDLSTDANGRLPVIDRKVDFEGGGLIHMERDFSRISLTTDKFLSYLKEDHLGGIREKVNLKKDVQKERYSRYLKCLVQSGPDRSDTLFKTALGQSLEIILLDNPYKLKLGEELHVRILFMGKPLVKKIISARIRNGSHPSLLFNASTNKDGICSFKILNKGEWFIHLTHMIECPDKGDADWESFWASYSFGI